MQNNLSIQTNYTQKQIPQRELASIYFCGNNEDFDKHADALCEDL